MPIFSFIKYTLTKLFIKPDNWQQIYKQTSSTFYTSNDVSLTGVEKNLLSFTPLRNKYLTTFFRKNRSSYQISLIKKAVLKNYRIFTSTPVLQSPFNSKYCKYFKSSCFEGHLGTSASENAFMKLRKIKKFWQEVLTLN